MMVALEPVRQKWGLDRIIVSTYQAVSGAGMGAILETQRELRDSVELITHDGKILKTSQIFWQADSEWAFTEKPFTYIDSLQGSITKGIGMDFDKSFSRLKAHKITGILPIKE